MAESEYRQKKLLYIYEEIDETFLQIISSAETYLDFLKNSSSNFRLNFEQQLMIYSRLKGAKAVATIEQWNKNGRYVISKAKGIPISDRDHVYSKNSYATVFDISQTSALENAKKVNIWERKVSDDIAIQDMLIQEYDLEYLRENKDVNYTQLIEAGVLREANEQLGSLNDKYENDDDFIKLIQAVIESTTTVVQARLNLDVNYDFNYITEFDKNTFFDVLEISVNASKLILSKIAKVVQINQSKNLMEEYENDRENIRESGRLLDSERDGRQEQELRDRKIWIDETSVLGERGQRRDDETNEIGNVTEASIGSEPTDSIESERAGRDYEGSRERDGGNEESGRPSLGEEDEQHNSQGGRIGNSRVRDSETKVESYEEKLERLENEWENSLFHSNESPDDNEINEYFDEMEDFYEYGDEYEEHMESLCVSPKTLPTEAEQLSFLTLNEVVDIEKSRYKFFTNEEVQGEIRTGSGFKDGKLRIQYQFETCKERKENAEFLKNEYGIGGYGKLNGISSWHDAKGLELNQDNATESIRKELIKWSEVADEIRILIDRNDYLNGDEVSKYNEYKFEREFKKEADEAYLEIIEEEYINEFDKVSERDFSSYVGREIYLDNRKFLIEELKHDEFHMRDITFAENVGFPIWRVENAELIANQIDELDKTKEESKQAKEKDNGTNYHITDENVGVGTPRERFRNNVEAITALKLCESENRQATAEEQQVLSKYVGWGGLSEAFDENKWGDEYLELHSLLDEQEYKSARSSTLTAFYTPPIVINSIYQTLQNIGFEKGNILEPSCGVGNFIGRKLEELYNSKIYGVELDDISGRIATLLYPQENISICGFEDTNFDDNFFDVAIGNVPFGDFKVLDKRYDKHNLLIHDYFFAKSLDKVRPGGVVAFITSQGTLDKANSKFRKYLNERAELLGAIRLPDDTFKSAAGTRVTSDIIFLQKREKINYADSNWMNLGTDENGITINQYFIENPQMVLGEMRLESGPFGEQSSCKALPNSKLDELLSDAITYINGKIDNIERAEKQENKDDLEVLQADPNVRNFSYTLVNDKVYYRENSIMLESKLPRNSQERIKGMIEIRDITRELIAFQMENYPDHMIENKQMELNKIFDSFILKYGYINNKNNFKVFRQDSSYALLCSLEEKDKDKEEVYHKAKIFVTRTIRPNKVVDKVETSAEALTLSVAEKMKIDFDYMESLCGKSKDEMIEELKGVIYPVPSYFVEIKYQTAEEYLSGNVREKLKLAKDFANDEKFSLNIEALEKVQPKDLEASEVSARLGVPWIPIDYVQEFMEELFNLPYYSSAKVQYSQITNLWNIANKSSNANVETTTTYGTEFNYANGLWLLENALNQAMTKVYKKVMRDGKEVAVVDSNATSIAQAKQEIIKEKFCEWVWSEPNRREFLLNKYNMEYNNIRLREYDGSHLNFVGLNNEIELRTHQKDAVARILYSGNTLLAHSVGAGKTLAMIVSAHMAVRLGLATKAMFVVPNHIINQFAADYMKSYPEANILVASKEDFEKKNRRKFVSRIATGNYEAVLIGHSQFEKIPLSVERQQRDLESQINEIKTAIDDEITWSKSYSVKQMEKYLKQLDIRLKKLNDQTMKDDVINFEELGVDMLFIDEVHQFKNLFTPTHMTNVAGVSQTESQKASDLYMKCRYLNEKTNYRGVVFATGTPISNTMVELFTMQRYLQLNGLQRKNLEHFDNWAATFGECVTATELAPEGTGYRTKTRFAKFINLPELMSFWKEVTDVKTADMLQLPTPNVEVVNVVCEISPDQKENQDKFVPRAEAIRAGRVDPSDDNMLKITHEGRLNGLDPRLLNKTAKDVHFSKVNRLVKNLFEIWQQKKIDEMDNPVQLVFCDISTPKGDGRFNVYDDVRNKLIAMDVPKEEIAFIHEAKNEKEKEQMFEDARNGKVRILFGSTFKMGSGTNCQDRLYAVHHLDCPWRPSDLQQRNGRIERQGNMFANVKIFNYVTEGTFDAYLWQIIEKKQKFISQIMTSKAVVRSADDFDEVVLSYAEIKALASGNPMIKEKMDLEIELTKLRLLRGNHQNEKYRLQDFIYKNYPKEFKEQMQRLENYQKDFKMVEPFLQENVPFEMILLGKRFNEKKDAGQALLETIKGVRQDNNKEIGNYMGLKMIANYDFFNNATNVILKGCGSYTVRLSTDVFGNLIRIDNMIKNAYERILNTKDSIQELDGKFASAKAEVDKPFIKEELYLQSVERLKELDSLLSLDKANNDALIIEAEEKNYEEGVDEFKLPKNSLVAVYEEKGQALFQMPRFSPYNEYCFYFPKECLVGEDGETCIVKLKVDFKIELKNGEKSKVLNLTEFKIAISPQMATNETRDIDSIAI